MRSATSLRWLDSWVSCLQSSRSVALLFALLIPGIDAVARETTQLPRREDGHPDLTGMWSNSNGTPLERPAGFDDLYLSDAQVEQLNRRLSMAINDASVPGNPSESLDERVFEKVRGRARSSLIVQPDDGRLPGTPLFKERFAALKAAIFAGYDGPEQRPTSDRCIISVGSAPPILSLPANNLHQIVQTDSAILFASESMHAARIIRMSDKHNPAAVHDWLGDSIGRWDGDTLVVETRNFHPADGLRVATNMLYLVSVKTRVTERFKLIGVDEIDYEFVVEDADLYTRPWVGQSHFLRSDERMFEAACHEGNYSLMFMFIGARAMGR